MSQFGEVEDVNLVRDEETGKSRGFAFLKYCNQTSTVLAVDNMNGAKLLERTLLVDHAKYRLPKRLRDNGNSSSDSESNPCQAVPPRQRGLPGHAYDGVELASDFSLAKGADVFAVSVDASTSSRRSKTSLKKRKKKSKNKKHKYVIDSPKRTNMESPMHAPQSDAYSSRKSVTPSASGWRGRREPQITTTATGQSFEGHNHDSGYGGLNRTR